MNRPQKVTQTPQDDPLAPVREKLVQALSLSPEGSSAHTVSLYGDGLRLTLPRADASPIYTYALPWARGWSVFVSAQENVTNHDWAYKAEGYSRSVPNYRNVVGPQYVKLPKLIDAIIEAIDYMEFHHGEHPTPDDAFIEGEIEDYDYFDENDTMTAGDCVFRGLS